MPTTYGSGSTCRPSLDHIADAFELARSTIPSIAIRSARGSPLKANADGSIDLYIQNESPGADKEFNWLPAPKGKFILMARLYWPNEKAPVDHRWIVGATGREEGRLSRTYPLRLQSRPSSLVISEIRRWPPTSSRRRQKAASRYGRFKMDARRCLSEMISLLEPHPHLLTESEKRSTQQANRYAEENAGSVFMPQPEERAHERQDHEE
jgi:Protein of unknown function (DUF1214)